MPPSQSKYSINQLILMAIISVLLISIVPVIVKWISANPATIGIVRLAIGALGIALLLLLSKQWKKIYRQELFWLVLLGITFGAHWYSYFYSIKMANASLASIGMSTFGIHLLILSSLIDKEKFKSSDIIAVIISAIGIYLASPDAKLELVKLQGFLLSIMSGLLYACLPIINKRLTRLPTNIRALGQFSFGLCIFLPLYPQTNFQLRIEDWFGLITLGIVSTLIAHTLWIKVSTELPTNITAVIYYGYVPGAMFFSYFLLNETMNWQKVVGALLIISANIMVIFWHRKTK